MKHYISLLLCFYTLHGLDAFIVDTKTQETLSNVMINDHNTTRFSDQNGSFSFTPNSGVLHLKAYGYRPLSFDTNTSDQNSSKAYKIELEAINVKALYLTFWAANNTSPRSKRVLEIIQDTDLNALVVDVKNEYGSLSFQTSFAQAQKYGAHENRTNRDINSFMQTMRENKIYTIARIATFKDELQASNNPEYAIKKKDATIWRNHDNMAWVDPFDVRSHEYALAVAEEAAKVGFDEINFDYIRFPARTGLLYSQTNTQENRLKAIESFLQKAQQRLQKYGVFISVDTYGNICWTPDSDNNIGQMTSSMAKYADYLSPMLYPSGFAKGSFYFEHPSEHPYEVIHRSLNNMYNEIEAKRVRPWLQYFRDYAHKRRYYKKAEIQAQIKASNDANTSGWMFWSPSSRYHKRYFIQDKSFLKLGEALSHLEDKKQQDDENLSNGSYAPNVQAHEPEHNRSTASQDVSALY